MPNGGTASFGDVERFFAPVAEAVTQFVTRRNLLLDKYYHDSDYWSLRFNHPKGGQATIEMRPGHGGRVLVASNWWFDDYDAFTRFIRRNEEYECACEPEQLVRVLEGELENIVLAPFGTWTSAFGGYEKHWGRYTKKEFEAMAPNYPLPTFD